MLLGKEHTCSYFQGLAESASYPKPQMNPTPSPIPTKTSRPHTCWIPQNQHTTHHWQDAQVEVDPPSYSGERHGKNLAVLKNIQNDAKRGQVHLRLVDMFYYWFPAKSQAEHVDTSLVKYLSSSGLDQHPILFQRTFFFSMLQTKDYEAIPIQIVQRFLWCYITSLWKGIVPALPAYLLRS